MLFVKEVSAELIGQVAAAAAVETHIDDNARHILGVEGVNHALPKLDGKPFIVAEGVDGDIAVAAGKNLELQRQFQAVDPRKRRKSD